MSFSDSHLLAEPPYVTDPCVTCGTEFALSYAPGPDTIVQTGDCDLCGREYCTECESTCAACGDSSLCNRCCRTCPACGEDACQPCQRGGACARCDEAEEEELSVPYLIAGHAACWGGLIWLGLKVAEGVIFWLRGGF